MVLRTKSEVSVSSTTQKLLCIPIVMFLLLSHLPPTPSLKSGTLSFSRHCIVCAAIKNSHCEPGAVFSQVCVCVCVCLHVNECVCVCMEVSWYVCVCVFAWK